MRENFKGHTEMFTKSKGFANLYNIHATILISFFNISQYAILNLCLTIRCLFVFNNLKCYKTPLFVIKGFEYLPKGSTA
jgi:hypothetical protein